MFLTSARKEFYRTQNFFYEFHELKVELITLSLFTFKMNLTILEYLNSYHDRGEIVMKVISHTFFLELKARLIYYAINARTVVSLYCLIDSCRVTNIFFNVPRTTLKKFINSMSIYSKIKKKQRTSRHKCSLAAV